MRASKFIALVAGIVGTIALFLPLAWSDGPISGFSMIYNKNPATLPVLIAFVPLVVVAIIAAFAIRARAYDGFWTLACSGVSLVGFVWLLVGVALFDVGSHLLEGTKHGPAHPIHIAAPAFTAAAVALLLGFIAGFVGENWPEERRNIT